MQERIDELNTLLRKTAPAVFDFMATEAGQAFLAALESHERTSASIGLRDREAQPGYWLAYCDALLNLIAMFRGHGALSQIPKDDAEAPTPEQVRTFLQASRGGSSPAL